MLIGYARVSTEEQEFALQCDALQAVGCEKIFQDKSSGATTKRKGLEEALAFLRQEDVLVVWKLDRLGRSVKDLVQFIESLDREGVQFRSLTEGIDTTTTAGRFFFHMMASLAEMERGLIRERTQAGLAAARQRGRTGGRPRKMTQTKIEAARTLLDDGIPPQDVALSLGISIPTLYRWIPASERS